METNRNRRLPRLPFDVPTPDEPRLRRPVRALRLAAYILAAAVLIAPAVQFQVGTMSRQDEAEELARQHPETPAESFKDHKGAIGRWRKAVRAMWAGWNIYRAPGEAPAGGASPGERASFPEGENIVLHPNMPFVVLLLTPLAYLPVSLMALTFNVAKLAALVAAMWCVCDVVRHHQRRIPDWVLGLGLLGAAPFIIGDIQHGNTNGFVLFAVALHLSLYRRGRTVGSGVALAAAICLKMTPALFALYWLYQRQWRLLAATVVALVVLAVVLPGAALGPDRHVELTRSWLENLILPGLVEGAWYPVHINQSISGVLSRYLLGGGNPNGDIFWNPDDHAYASLDEHGWIALADLSDATTKWLIRLAQGVVVLLGAWAIGWRKLPRDDGRRALHYGLVGCGMMLLNQRTWDHHAPVLLIAHTAIWCALGFGRLRGSVRIGAFCAMVLSWLLVWVTGSDICRLLAEATGNSRAAGEHWGNLVQAYGPTFYSFLLVFLAGVVIALNLKGRTEPYADRRQPLWR